MACKIISADEQKIEHKILNILLSIGLSICLRCSEELSHWDDSFEYPQHMFWLRNKNNFDYTLNPCLAEHVYTWVEVFRINPEFRDFAECWIKILFKQN